MRLFAELKERGEDGPEVHSALVEAFCRSGQGEVAMDAYRNMLAQGLAPAPAAARAVLEIHVQAGAWEQADAVMGGMAERAAEAGDGGGGSSGGGDGEAVAHVTAEVRSQQLPLLPACLPACPSATWLLARSTDQLLALPAL